MSSIPPICSAVHLPFGILPPAVPFFFRAPAAPPHPKTKKPVSAPAPSPPAALLPAAQAFPLLESGAKSGPSRGRGSRNGSCQAQPGISPRSAGTRRQLTSRCPSGMLLNEWAASQRIRTIPCMAIWASADFYRSACMSEYELKSKKGSMGHKIAGGTYDTFIRSTAAILIRLASF